MNLASQLQHRYEWTPNYRLVFKKPAPSGLKTFRVPQTTGILGWIIFTYDKFVPVCLWISAQECIKIPCCVDERICGDTFLRVEKVDELTFIVSDIWMYNSNCVYMCSTFSQRYDWLKAFLPIVTQPHEGFATFLHKSKADEYDLRGYEDHPEEIGKPGFFVEKEVDMVTVTKLQIPDCYEIAGKGYLRVPDLKTSIYLRSKEDTFMCKCVPYDEEFWDVVENIPEIEVNES